jgi:hypothetical protein
MSQETRTGGDAGRTMLAVAAAAVLVLSSCGKRPPLPTADAGTGETPPADAPTEGVAFTTIARSGCTPISVKQIIRTQSEWSAFLSATKVINVNWPTLDFDREMVVMVGNMGNLGCTMEIGQVLPQGKRLTVKYALCSGQAMSVAQCCHIIRTEADAHQAEFIGLASPNQTALEWCARCKKDPHVPCR